MGVNQKSLRFVLGNVSVADAPGLKRQATGSLFASQGTSEAFLVCKLWDEVGREQAKLDLRFSSADGLVHLKNGGSAPLDVLGHLELPDRIPNPRKRTTPPTKAETPKKRQATESAKEHSQQPANVQRVAVNAASPRKAKTAERQQLNLKFVESTGERVERHGAQRDSRPAWMTKGCGIGKRMFGEAGQGDDELLKPGMTRGQLEKIEQSKMDDNDPFADVFREAQGKKASDVKATQGNGKTWRQSGPLPSQDKTFRGGHGWRRGHSS